MPKVTAIIFSGEFCILNNEHQQIESPFIDDCLIIRSLHMCQDRMSHVVTLL